MAVVIPEIFSDAVNAKMTESLRIGKVAFDATDMVGDIRDYGDKVHFPKFDRIGSAETMTKGNSLTPADVSMTDAYATIKQVGKAVRVYDKDKVQIKGAVVDRMAE